MKTSVIIPTLNAGESIRRLCSALLSQDIEPPEIVVIDSSSDDDTVAIAEGFGVKVLAIPRAAFNHGKTRNLAAMESSGQILFFMTQDALPADTTLLSRLIASLSQPDIAAAFGRHIPRSDASPLEAFARYFNYPERASVKGRDDITRCGIKTFFFSNVCSAVKREAFLKVGMFPEGVRANEDMLIAARLISAGYRIAYVPEARVIHSHNYSLFTLFKRYYNIGSSVTAHKSILQDVRAESEGMRFVKEQIRYVAKQRKYSWLPRILLESSIKYAGYRAGLRAG